MGCVRSSIARNSRYVVTPGSPVERCESCWLPLKSKHSYRCSCFGCDDTLWKFSKAHVSELEYCATCVTTCIHCNNSRHIVAVEHMDNECKYCYVNNYAKVVCEKFKN